MFKEWGNTLDQNLDSSRALSVGILNPDGDILYSNRSFRDIFDVRKDGIDLVSNMVSPSFSQFKAEGGGQKLIFDGIITISDGLASINSYSGRVYSGGNQFLIVAELNSDELREINCNLGRLNREVTDLQRKLIKEKSNLESTLDQLKETQQMLIHSEKMNALGHLVAGVAHEVNNPISFIKSNLQTLGESFRNLQNAFVEAEDLFEQIGADMIVGIKEQYDVDFIFDDTPSLIQGSLDGLERVKKIVENLRVFSRLDESEFKETDLEENIRASVDIAQHELSERRINVEYSINDIPDLNTYISELNQVFLNMIINAAQAIGSDGTIRIRAFEEGGNAVIEIEDDGEGIYESNLEKIFNPFFTTRDVGDGTGLGLSIASKIIEDKHGGRIEVESTPGEGSVFRILIPRNKTNDENERSR